MKSLEKHGCYDGWFDRAIPRSRLTNSMPSYEPFDLSQNGEMKVRREVSLHQRVARRWIEAADYFHFPGVMTFNSIADLNGPLGQALGVVLQRLNRLLWVK